MPMLGPRKWWWRLKTGLVYVWGGTLMFGVGHSKVEFRDLWVLTGDRTRVSLFVQQPGVGIDTPHRETPMIIRLVSILCGFLDSGACAVTSCLCCHLVSSWRGCIFGSSIQLWSLEWQVATSTPFRWRLGFKDNNHRASMDGTHVRTLRPSRFARCDGPMPQLQRALWISSQPFITAPLTSADLCDPGVAHGVTSSATAWGLDMSVTSLVPTSILKLVIGMCEFADL